MTHPQGFPKIIALIVGGLVLLIICCAGPWVLSGFWNLWNSSAKDITRDPAYGNFSVVVGPWKTKTQLWLMEIDGKRYLSTTSAHYNETYRDIATFPPGTEIRIDKLTVNFTFEGKMFRAWGSLVSGPESGKTFELDPDLFGADCQKSLGMREPLKPVETWSVAADRLEK